MFKYEQHMKADRLLWNTPRPINKMIFLYEDKNTQELKEFTVKYDEELWKDLEAKYEYINEYVAKRKKYHLDQMKLLVRVVVYADGARIRLNVGYCNGGGCGYGRYMCNVWEICTRRDSSM